MFEEIETGSSDVSSSAGSGNTETVAGNEGATAQGEVGTGATGGEGEAAAAATTTETKTETVSEFVLPEEYKDKPWAAKVKSTDDLYKQIDNLTALAGKKNAYPTADATPEQLNEYYAGLRPESAEAYDFGADHPNPEIAKQFGDMLFKSNISAHQSKQLIADYQAYEKAIIEQGTSAEGFKDVMTKQFGEKYDTTVANVSKSLEQYASADDQKIINAMPNQYLGSVYKLMDSILKAHGVNEGGDNLHSEKGGTNSTVSVETQRSELRAKINALEKMPHTAQQKQELVDALQFTYSNNRK